MLDKRFLESCNICREMNSEDQKYWFDFKKSKFLHNIDTFYYSVKFINDFTADSLDMNVMKFRKYFDAMNRKLSKNVNVDFLQLDFGSGFFLNLRPFSFAKMYNVCLEYPEWFDIFLAPVVPKSSDSAVSVTCELVVQIRSYMLWIYGVNESFERSYEYVQALAEHFGLQIAYAQENRIDYCWHSNYLSNPERFFSLENFYKMRVDRFNDAVTHTEKKGSQDYEIDYVALGKRTDKVFVRIYMKSKEVVEMGYKGWFFYFWLFNGLINRYDLHVYEECYKRRSWQYLNMARASFYLEHGSDESAKSVCRSLLSGEQTMEEDTLQKFVDTLTPKVNLIMNVEYQTRRRHSKSYVLLPLRDNKSKLAAKRIYDYLDNRKLIIDYLTNYVFRLVEPEGDVNKSRREMCGFWKSLRSCKLVDIHVPPKQLKLVREYSRHLNADLVKRRAINSIVTLGFYNKGMNEDDIMQDVVDALCTLNDNDVEKALRYKTKKAQQLNTDELPGSLTYIARSELTIIDKTTGEVYSHNSMSKNEFQGDFTNE